MRSLKISDCYFKLADMDLLNSLAEKNLAEAIARGELDNLPGAGSPLNLDDDRMVPPELRVGYRILKNAGFLPPEISLHREIRSVEELLTLSVPESAEYCAAERRLHYLRLQLAESRGGSALLDDTRFRTRLLKKLTR